MNYNDYDLIVTNYTIKKEILKNVDVFLKPKIITKKELINMVFGEIDKNSLYFLMKEKELNINLANVYLKNIYFLEQYLEFVKEKKIITEPLNFKYKNVLIINEFIDPYIIKKLNNTKISYYSYEKDNNKHKVYKFSKIEEEINFVANEISKLLKTVDINNIKIVNKNNEYNNLIKKVFNFYNIPINLKENHLIYKIDDVKEFLQNLKRTKNIETSIEKINDNEIKSKIINLLNNFIFDEINNYSIEIIEEELKTLSIKDDLYKNAVDFISLNEMFNTNNHYFFINLNEGEIPKEYKDEDYFSDDEKLELGILTSNELNKFEKDLFVNIYNNFSNIIYSYKENSLTKEYLPSYLINELNMEVVKDYNNDYNYSSEHNKLNLAKMLDNLILYNEVNNDLSKLYSNYKNIPYMNYDNSFSGLENNKIDNLNLSFTSVNEYFHCPFSYYVKRVLKLEKFEDTIHLFIGNLFHSILEKMYDEDFNFDNEFNNFINENKLDSKNLFYLNNLKQEIKFAINIIKKMEANTSLKEIEKELYLEITKENYKINGVIDKVLYKNEDGKFLTIIIDYKTGNITSSLDNINHGLNLQLPIYSYLINECRENTILGGVYLQQVLNKLEVDKDEIDLEKNMYLQGYTINNLNLIKLIDESYSDSEMIRGLKETKSGFSKLSKLLTEEEFEKIINVAKNKVEEAATNILDSKFDIEPKILKDKKISCAYCKFKDLCFVKEEDFIELEDTKFEDVIV